MINREYRPFSRKRTLMDSIEKAASAALMYVALIVLFAEIYYFLWALGGAL